LHLPENFAQRTQCWIATTTPAGCASDDGDHIVTLIAEVGKNATSGK
jgi:hypothetical protein